VGVPSHDVVQTGITATREWKKTRKNYRDGNHD